MIYIGVILIIIVVIYTCNRIKYANKLLLKIEEVENDIKNTIKNILKKEKKKTKEIENMEKSLKTKDMTLIIESYYNLSKILGFDEEIEQLRLQYNDYVLKYDNLICSFPNVIVFKILNYKVKYYFRTK